ncbi:MAG: hypothetical protein HY906_02865 [Deltaproteobacteria bacterium]|nr:hypothetical protein [Deltaproteobacteria bacterium]
MLHASIIDGQAPTGGMSEPKGAVHAEGIGSRSTVLSGFTVLGYDVSSATADNQDGTNGVDGSNGGGGGSRGPAEMQFKAPTHLGTSDAARQRSMQRRSSSMARRLGSVSGGVAGR